MRVAAVASAEGRGRARVVLTREAGQNDKLGRILAEMHGVASLEVPLIEFGDAKDTKRLPEALRDEVWDWVVVTSPEAAKVLVTAWWTAGRKPLRTAAVGGGTAKVLAASGLAPAFTPSKAYGADLAAELPAGDASTAAAAATATATTTVPPRVLYPASARAKVEVQEGLRARGFDVTRLDTYDTVAVSSLHPSLEAQAMGVPVVAFASPSAVKAWAALFGTSGWRPHAACIGKTSAAACTATGLFATVLAPADGESPGLDTWARLCAELAAQTPE